MSDEMTGGGGGPYAAPESTASSTAEPGFGAMLAATFTSPATVGESIARRGMDGRVWAALFLGFALAVGSLAAVLPLLQRDSIEVLAQQDMPDEQREMATKMFEGGAGKALVLVGPMFFILLTPLAVGLCLHLGQMLLGGRSRFGQSFAVAAFATVIPLGLGSVVKSALAMAKGSYYQVVTGFGALALDRPVQDTLRVGLTWFDIFVMWAVWSAGGALAPSAGLTRGKALAVSIGIFLLWGVLFVGMNVVGQLIQGAAA